MPGRLTVCATPIGNLADAPPRLREVLADADLVLAEDTRRAATLLRSLGVDVAVESYFVGNEAARAEQLGERLEQGQHVALLTDAGTPVVSDPGLRAVQAARRHGATISLVPGPSAVTAALSVSGFSGDRFAFEGFLPRRGEARTRRLAEIARESRPVVFFSAPSRLVEDLRDLLEAAGPDRRVVVARELTKLYEEIWDGTLADAVAAWSERTPKGEFTVVVGEAETPSIGLDAALADVEARMAAGESLSAAVREVAEVTGVRRRDLYAAALERSSGG